MEKSITPIIIRAQEGDEEAFIELYHHFQEPCLRYAMKLCECEADAKDVVQETFISIHKYIKTLRDPEYFYAWMSKIVYNKTNTFYKRKKKTMTIEDENILHQVEKTYDQKHSKHQITDEEVLHHFIDELPEKQAMMLRYVYIDQLTTKEVSRRLGIAEGTVKSRIYKAKRTLKKHIEQFEKDEQRKLILNQDAIVTVVSLRILKVWKNLMQKPMLAGMSMITGMTCMVVIMTHPYIGADNNQTIVKNALHTKESFRQVAYKNKPITNAKVAYYVLRLWASDVNQVEHMNTSQKREVYEIFEALKESQSPYYNALENSGWVASYLKYEEK